VNSSAGQQFKMICKSPAQIGDPAQVEACLFICMAIWSAENLPPGKNHAHTAVGIIRRLVPELTDRAGLMFHDIKTHERDYKPVIEHMTEAFDLLRSFAKGSSVERRVKHFAAFVAEQNKETAHRMKQVFCETLCPGCWSKRPSILDMAFKASWCNCFPRQVP